MLQEKTPVLPTVLDTIKAGLEFTTKHLWLVMIPVLLDGFYWLGPRLSVRPVLETMAGFVVQQAAAAGQPETTITEFAEQMKQLAESVNLFSQLNLPLIGIPTLMSGLSPEKTPIQPFSIELDNAFLILLVAGILSGIGLGLSALYYGLIAKTIRGEAVRISWLWHDLPLLLAKLFGFFLLVGLIAVILFTPFFCMSFLTILISPNLTMLLWFIGAMPAMTLVLYGFFGPHAILLHARPVLIALRESINLVRQHQMTAIGLFLLVYIVGNGMTLLWRIADNGSWLTLVSIVGHGFVSTSLAAATFIFYRDRYPTLPTTTYQPPETQNSKLGT